MALLPNTGEAISGFTISQKGRISMLGAETVEFIHSVSGARLLYIQADDRELGFNLIYRTPQFDESDACHMLEHLLLCSSKKYPSRDIFFDMDCKSYATFMNGITDNAYTCYPVCTQSENQLLQLMDVFLSCMEEPEALEDKHFFLREGLRLELEAPQGPLSMNGTVLEEDWGHLTDLLEQADSHMAHALYPGLLAANLLGRAHLHYPQVSYDKICSVYERCYHYSNCLIVLYGKMDYRRVLEFLDKEHLSLYPAQKPSLLPLFSEPSPTGFHEVLAQSPAYTGSDSRQASVIDYAVDLSVCSWKELIWWDLTAEMLDNETSVWHSFALEEGLNHVMEVYVDSAASKPSLKFRLHNADAKERSSFLRCIRRALSHTALHGVSSALYEASLKENQMQDLLTREAPHLAFNLSEEIGRYWSLTGKTDYFPLYDEALREFMADTSQSILRSLASRVMEPENSALVVTSPVPGLAEALEAERETWLAKKLADMTASEIQELIQSTQDFKQWNQSEKTNMDFLIAPKELPEPEPEPDFTVQLSDDITCYLSPAPCGFLGSFQLFFDLSAIPQEDWDYLTLYQMLLTELDTERFSVQQQKNLEQSLLHDCTFDELCPDTGKENHPMMSVFWYSLSEDFEQSLDFLLDIMENARYSQTETIIRILDKYSPDYDQSKADNASSLAYSLAEGCIRQDSRFRYLLNSPRIYGFLKTVRRKLEEETGYSEFLNQKLTSIARTILNRNHLVFMAAASPDTLKAVFPAALKRLKRLPLLPEEAFFLPALPSQAAKTAACVDAPSQEIRMLGDFKNEPAFRGRFLPFLLAAGDRYIKPEVRYRGKAYDSGVDFLLPAGYFTLWSTADSDVKTTIDIFRNAGERLGSLPISAQDLRGYILSAYAQALPPMGLLNTRMRAMRRHMAGVCPKALYDMISDIKNSSLSDQKEAAQIINQLLKNGPVSVVGNAAAIMEQKELFDQILHIRSMGETT